MKNYLLILCAYFILFCSCYACSDSNNDENKTDNGKEEQEKPLEIKFSKGVNLSDWFLANSDSEIYKNVYSKQDFENIKSLGIDAVRLPVRFYKIADAAPDYTLSQSFLDKLDYALDLAEEVGLHIIIDNHSYFASNAFPQNYGEEQLTKIWQQVAQHCKNRSDLVYYELYNEPDGDYMKQNWGEMQGRFIEAIRKIDTKHTIIVGSCEANSPTTLKDLPQYEDKNLIYTFHFYDPFLFTHQGSDWTLLKNVKGVPFPYESASSMPECPPDLVGTGKWGDGLFANYPTDGTVAVVKNNIDEAVTFARSRNVPVFCGEFGVYMDGTDNDQRCFWYKTVCDYFKEKNIAWTMWDYHNSFGLYKVGTSYRFEYDLNVALLEALKLNVPPSYTSGDKPNIPFYMDNISDVMKDASWNPDGQLNFDYQIDPYQGTKSIYWKIGSEWSSLTIEIWPTISATEQLNAEYVLQFAIKSTSKINMQVRFVEYQDSSYPWRNTFSITEGMIKDDGSWSVISIPLSSFVETGAVKDGNYYESQGLFNWGHINRLEFAIEGNENMINTVLQIDNIQITKPK